MRFVCVLVWIHCVIRLKFVEGIRQTSAILKEKYFLKYERRRASEADIIPEVFGRAIDPIKRC